ncbi:MAG: biotin--[acetyl-CoA-carboxylase] ligase [Hyphomicrobiaceae bacterium]|nr:biotin--[acetyl-CoA-carboxylase] ligase [Hyphomicrobiaceae bacterium]
MGGEREAPVAQSIPILVLDQVGSTNREAFALAEAGEAGPLWIIARRQTAGRGRSDRPWVSMPGNLHASLLTRLPDPPGALPQLSLVAGVATIDAIRQAAGGGPAGLRLKWPNDVLIGQAKCAGILIESIASRNTATVVIGIGIDLAWHPADLGRAATDLAAHGCRVPPEAVLASLSEAMHSRLAAWDGGRGFAALRQAWLERAGPVGEMIAVNTGRKRMEGTFAGLDAEGALVICDAHGQRRTVTFGDVTLVAAAPQEAG